MNTSALQKYNEILDGTNEIALATSIDNIPNVRIVSFVRKAEHPGVIYFATDRTNQKVAEFSKNEKVAFTSIPPNSGVPHVRSQNAVVRKSALPLNEVKDLFCTIPGYDETIAAIGETLDVFEIHVKEAIVIAGFEAPDILTF